MKTISSIVLLLFFVGCATKSNSFHSLNEEAEIVRLAAEQYKTMEYEKFNILEIPNNHYIEYYLKGLYQGPIELPGVTFSYTPNPILKWDKKKLGKSIASKKVVIVKNYDKIPIVSWETPEKASPYFSFSNPAFSKDGQYAIININFLPNLELYGGLGYIMIFKKINGQWVYQDKFEAYLT